MAFFNEKWRNSTVPTKIAAWAMALATLLALIGNIPVVSAAFAVGSVAYGIFWLLFVVGLMALLTFGLFKVNRFARTVIILEGISSVFAIIMVIATYRAASNVSGGLYGLLYGLIWALIPAAAKAIIGLYILPFVLCAISMVCLFIGGRDFKKIKKEAE